MRRLTLATLMVLASSCYQWQMRPVAPLAAGTDNGPSTMRVTRSDGSQIVLSDATVGSDSLYGQRRVGYYGSAEHSEPLQNVRAVGVRRLNDSRTAALLTVFAALAIATGIYLHALTTAFN